MDATHNPLVGPPPAEVPLARAPLVRVVAQVRFGEVLSIGGMVPAFQEEIRSEYPGFQRESTEVQLRAGESERKQSVQIWRFLDPGGAWRLSVSTGFLAIETTSYKSRDDFLRRFRASLDALEKHVHPGALQRLGVRFVSRVKGEDLKHLDRLVREEILSLRRSQLGDQLRMDITHSQFDIPDEGGLLWARWGLLPKGLTVDPAAIEPLDEPSWILDFDAFINQECSFDVGDIESKARRLAERTYSMFRWAVTQEFLRHYGGEP